MKNGNHKEWMETGRPYLKIDWVTTLVPLAGVVILCLLFFLIPVQTTWVIDAVRGFLGDELGFYYTLLGCGALICSLYMAFSRFGKIRLGSTGKPEYSSFKWGTMIFTSTMAADILLYQTDLVPVGLDQKQHVEIARDVAIRFNNRYGETFRVPEALLGKTGAKIMSLQEPDKKMSKSDENLNASIFFADDKDTIIRKFKRAVTDSGNEIKYDPENKAGVSNLLSIYSAFTGKSIAEAEADFAGKGYGEFKLAVGEAVADKIAPIQAEQSKLLADKAYLESALKSGAERANRAANKTLSKVYKKIGFYQF